MYDEPHVRELIDNLRLTFVTGAFLERDGMDIVTIRHAKDFLFVKERSREAITHQFVFVNTQTSTNG
jgi:hypothetical protein